MGAMVGTTVLYVLATELLKAYRRSLRTDVRQAGTWSGSQMGLH